MNWQRIIDAIRTGGLSERREVDTRDWICPIHGVIAESDLHKHESGEWGSHGYCSAPVMPQASTETHDQPPTADQPRKAR